MLKDHSSKSILLESIFSFWDKLHFLLIKDHLALIPLHDAFYVLNSEFLLQLAVTMIAVY